MKLTKYTLILFGLMCFLGSCTMEKMRYSSGYHVEWNVFKKSKGEAQPRWERSKTKPAELTAAQDVAITAQSAPVVEKALTYAPAADADKDVVAPVFVRPAAKATARIAQVKTAIKKQFATPQVKAEKQKPSPVNNGPGEVQWKALLLAIFFGWAGMHRFYLGYKWQGWVQLLTGGFGIWWLVDAVRIAFGWLQPKGDSYRKSFYK